MKQHSFTCIGYVCTCNVEKVKVDNTQSPKVEFDGTLSRIEKIKQHVEAWKFSHEGIEPYYDMSCLIFLLKELQELEELTSLITYPNQRNGLIIEEYYV